MTRVLVNALDHLAFCHNVTFLDIWRLHIQRTLCSRGSEPVFYLVHLQLDYTSTLHQPGQFVAWSLFRI